MGGRASALYFMDIKEQLLNKYDNVDLHALTKYLECCNADDECQFTESHHILPRHSFPEYECLKSNPWNKVDLSGANHFVAHYWFARAVDTWAAWNSIVMMTNGIGDRNAARNWSDDELSNIAISVNEAKSRIREIGLSDEIKSKISKSNSGKTRSGDAKRNISDSLKGKLKTQDHKQKLSNANKGKKPSVKCLNLLRTGAQWKPPLYNMLWNEWNSVTDKHGNKLKRGRFNSHCIKNKLIQPDLDLSCLVSHFNRIESGVDCLIGVECG